MITKEKLEKNEIKNIDTYINSMRKSLDEKAFFLGKIDSDCFLDYGCADGALLKYLQSINPNCKYMGYDICQEMLKVARKDSNIIFTDDLEKFDKIKTENSTLILSSIIHEIYTYADPDKFWEQVFDKINPKYIVIRDMMIRDEQRDAFTDSKDAKLLKIKTNKYFLDFEKRWATIEFKKSFIHYLLKYRYVNNWEREVKENYLPITIEDLMELIPDNYRITFLDHYTPEFLKKCVKEDFGIDLKEKTHIKMIIERID